MRRAILLVFLLLIVTPTGAQDDSPLIITGGTIIDGTGAEPLAGAWLVLDGERIAEVITDPALYDPPEGARFLDAGGGTVLPGFTNAHTHFTNEPEVRHEDFLLRGVTSICNLATSLEGMPVLAQDTTGDGLPAARGLMAGPMITAPGGYPGPVWGYEGNYEVEGPAEAAEAVADLIENHGADFIKIPLEPSGRATDWPVLSLDEVRAITGAAHDHGTVVIAHVEDFGYLERALDGGVDVITHAQHRWKDDGGERLFSGDPANPVLHESYPPLLERMVEEDVIWMPTLDVLSLRPGALRRAGMLEAARQFHAMGGRLAVGNDWPLGDLPAGIPLGEMRLLVDAGLDEMAVIVAGTATAATVCGHGDDLGTLEPGKRADVVIVAGDPLADLSALEDVTTVILNGEIVEP